MTESAPHIPPALLQACFAHGAQTYPQEGCGVLSGPQSQAGLVEQFHPLPNTIDALQAQDPQRYPRSSRQGYVMDPLALHTLERQLRQQERLIRVYMHSHVDVGAYFSAEDEARALWAGQPIAPGIAYLVCGIRQHQPDGAILAIYNPRSETFETFPL